MEEKHPDKKTPIIDKDVQLGAKIIRLHSNSASREDLIPLQLESGETIWAIKKETSLYPEVFTDDLVLANLNDAELKAVRLGLDFYFHLQSFGERYKRDLVEPARMLSNQIAQIVITSRGRRMEAGKLAKTQYQFQESKYEERPPREEKKSFWRKFLGG